MGVRILAVHLHGLADCDLLEIGGPLGDLVIPEDVPVVFALKPIVDEGVQRLHVDGPKQRWKWSLKQLE